jgi:phosphate transport system substrate-binding protein
MSIGRIALILVGLVHCGMVHAQLGSAASIRGAGASLPATIYTSWGQGFTKERSIPVTFQAVGSGEGVKRIIAREVDFGASDVPVSREEIKRTNLFQFPTVVGGIVPVVSFRPGGSGQLRLTGSVLADIFAGRITEWNDPRIAELNPGSDLPKVAIIRIVREDSSGTTAAFTSYLSLVNENWSRSIGSGNTVSWPGTVTRARGNDGVVEALKGARGAITYVSLDRIARDKLNPVLLENRQGKFVAPSEAGLKAAVKASAMNLTADEYASLLNMPGSTTWPITQATFVLVDRAPKTAASVSQTLSFFYWAFMKGDDIITKTGFVPLPTAMQARITGRFKEEIKPQDGGPLQFMK